MNDTDNFEKEDLTNPEEQERNVYPDIELLTDPICLGSKID